MQPSRQGRIKQRLGLIDTCMAGERRTGGRQNGDEIWGNSLQLSYFKPSTEAALPSRGDSAGTARPITAGLYLWSSVYLDHYTEKGFMGKPGAHVVCLIEYIMLILLSPWFLYSGVASFEWFALRLLHFALRPCLSIRICLPVRFKISSRSIHHTFPPTCFDRRSRTWRTWLTCVFRGRESRSGMNSGIYTYI